MSSLNSSVIAVKPLKRTLGPLDKRKTLTRCQSCARRKIKCQGPFPCEYCVRTNKPCRPLQPESTTAVKFIAVQAPAQEEPSITHRQPQPFSLINESPDLVYMSHFASFMADCQFTRSFSAATIASDLLPLIHQSPPLRTLTLAIGALQSSRRATVRSVNRQHDPRTLAFRLYAEAIQGLKCRLEGLNVDASDDVLWATFLFGIFEVWLHFLQNRPSSPRKKLKFEGKLLTETSGDPWATHMLYGTARLFQIAGASTARATELKGRLFDAFCILEIKRALLFGDDTFLSQDEWLVPKQELGSPPIVETDQFLDLLPFMHTLASFSYRFFSQIESIPAAMRPHHATIVALAHEGVAMHQQLRHRILLTSPYPSHEDETYYALSKAFLSAMSLFHCNNFRYYSCWDHVSIPSLSPDEISTHCCTILGICSGMINGPSRIPGVILLFPLRVTGLHLADDRTRTQVLQILAQIRQQGFVVADRIRVDLEEVWKFQDSMSQPVELG